MAASPILGITELASAQTGKSATVNGAIERAEASANDTLDVDFTSADQTVSLDDFQKHVRFRCINVSTARVLTLPANKRKVTIRSSIGNTANVTVTLGTTTLQLAPGQMFSIYTDGTANGMEKINDPAFEPVNTYTSSQTLALVDLGCLVKMNSGSANNLTVPPNASVAFPIGSKIAVCQYGAGATTLVAGAGVTIRRKNTLVMSAQYGRVQLHKIATDEWLASGDLT